MPSIRLRKDQIERLKKSANASEEIRRACSRYEAGCFSMTKRKLRQKNNQPLLVFPITSVPMHHDAFTADDVRRYSSAEIRAILDMHWNTPDEERKAKLAAEIAEQEKTIADLMAQYQAMPYRTEKQDDD